MEGSPRKRTIVISANSLWNILNFRRPLIERVQRAGFAIIVAAPKDGVELPPNLGAHHIVPLSSEGLNPVADARLFLRYLALFARVRPAAYLSFTAKPNIYGALAASLLKVPSLPNVSGLGTAFIRGGLLQRLLSALYRLAFWRAPVVFFQNGEDRELFLANRLVQPHQARLLTGSGVDLERFQPVSAEASSGSGCSFLFVGRLIGDKGVREFVEAARLVKRNYPDSRFQLLGFSAVANRTAIGADELARWEAEGIVEYLGSSDDVRPHLAAADAVVLPSYREGLPRSLLEAAAMGRPLIASNVPGNRDVVIDQDNGFLCEVRSAASLAEACERFIRLPAADKLRMGQASRRLAEERFSEETVFAAYLAAVSEVARPALRARS